MKGEHVARARERLLNVVGEQGHATVFIAGQRDRAAIARLLSKMRIGSSTHGLAGAELRRGHAGHCAEGAGEGAVVVEAALVRDLGDRAVGLAKEA